VLHSEAGTLPLDMRAHRPADLAARAIHVVASRASAKRLVLDGLLAEVGEVSCDSGRIVGVLADLLDNAIHASPPEATITVRAEVREVAERCSRPGAGEKQGIRQGYDPTGVVFSTSASSIASSNRTN
jgi:signal transduction histidine kinase